MKHDDSEAAIRAGVADAVVWPALVTDSMAAQFESVRIMMSRTSELIPPLVATPGGSSWDGVTGLVSAVEAQAREIEQALTARVISNAAWFGIPAPADINEKLSETESDQ